MKRIPITPLVLALIVAGYLLLQNNQIQSQDEPQAHSLDVYAMSTFVSLTLYSHDETIATDLLARSSDLIYAIENEFSTTLTHSTIYNLNHDKGDVWYDISSHLREVVLLSHEMATRTNHAFDPTIYPLMLAWGFTQNQQIIPSQAEIDALLPFVDMSAISLSDTQGISLPTGMGLDLGGVAKGYACDLIAQLWTDAGVTGTISLGGNVHTIGLRPDGNLWNIGIQDPETGGVFASVPVANQAVVTSGGYQRFFEVDGTTYIHILDPKTGKPASTDLTSVSIIADSGAIADALSTALFVMGQEQAIEHWRAHQDFEMILVSATGEVTVTPNLNISIAPSYEGSVTTL